MPSAIPPVTNGAEVDSSRCRPELGAAAACVADGAPPPAAASVVFASADCARAAAGVAHWPSAFTMSSGPTGPWGPKLTLPVLARAQSGLAKTGFENQPPSFWSSNTCAVFLHPATTNVVAQANAMLK